MMRQLRRHGNIITAAATAFSLILMPQHYLICPFIGKPSVGKVQIKRVRKQDDTKNLLFDLWSQSGGNQLHFPNFYMALPLLLSLSWVRKVNIFLLPLLPHSQSTSRRLILHENEMLWLFFLASSLSLSNNPHS